MRRYPRLLSTKAEVLLLVTCRAAVVHRVADLRKGAVVCHDGKRRASYL